MLQQKTMKKILKIWILKTNNLQNNLKILLKFIKKATILAFFFIRIICKLIIKCFTPKGDVYEREIKKNKPIIYYRHIKI